MKVKKVMKARRPGKRDAIAGHDAPEVTIKATTTNAVNMLLIAKGLKEGECHKSFRKYGNGGRYLLVRGKSEPGSFPEAARQAYVKALGHRPTSKKADVDILQEHAPKAPAAILATLGAPKQYSQWTRSQRPAASVAGSCDNWVWPVSPAMTVMPKLPKSIKPPGLAQPRLKEPQLKDLRRIAHLSADQLFGKRR
eukprot:gnl/TRDRNA2_/TRDRNA2_71802_c0_seq1.p1 gnl/TRDRNA2_/TRDRNA2_71802_c0~~gnl/TRDRNA2_/TRDRNA2_71802_c0_seq1.p1  ORF type:complete len:195 (-),score=26.68 gnl/TRDRNA2_/TRDRNA2_71802_c0_seq1:134-718(-)